MKDVFNEWFYYENGKLYWKRRKKQSSIKVGDEAGCNHIKGYRAVRFNNKVCLTHRIIYEMLTGEDLTGWEIDHINGIRNDNRIENLRKVSHTENNQHRTKLNCNNKTGHSGISKTPGGKYEVRVKVNTIQNYLGVFDSLDEAVSVKKTFLQEKGR